MAAIAAQEWDPAATRVLGKKASTANSTVFSISLASGKGAQATRVQTPWIPSWSITHFPAQAAAQPDQNFLQLTASDYISKTFLDKYLKCEEACMDSLGPSLEQFLSQKEQKAMDSYQDMLKSSVGHLGADAPPFMRAQISKACQTYYTHNTDSDIDDTRNIMPLEDDIKRAACKNPEQKTMQNGGKFFVHDRADDSMYLSAIISMDSFVYRHKPQQGAERHCLLQPRVEQILLAPVTDAYVQAAGSYVDAIKQDMNFGFFKPTNPAEIEEGKENA